MGWVPGLARVPPFAWRTCPYLQRSPKLWIPSAPLQWFRNPDESLKVNCTYMQNSIIVFTHFNAREQPEPQQLCEDYLDRRIFNTNSLISKYVIVIIFLRNFRHNKLLLHLFFTGNIYFRWLLNLFLWANFFVLKELALW